MRISKTKYSFKKMVGNILDVYNNTEQHHRYDWYGEANSYAIELANASGLSIAQCCGIIAAFSPLKNWNENKRIAKVFITIGKTEGLHTALFVGKATDIRGFNPAVHGNESDYILQVLRGAKISSFFLNILNPNCAKNVTIDRHAICIALGKKLSDDQLQITKPQYELIKQAYLKAADIAGISPVLLQSSTWLLWRTNGQLKMF